MTQPEERPKKTVSRMLTREDRVVLDEMLEETKEIKLQLRRIGNNINQLARTANVTGNVEAMQELERLQEDLDYYGREADDIWQSLKRLQNRRRPKGD